MAEVLVIGGGLAGMAAAAALGQSGRRVTLLEARPSGGGRAASYLVPGAEPGGGTVIDNCQHILLRCCVNLLDFYRRLGVESAITFHREFYFIEPGGRTSVLKAGALPHPLHLAPSFARLKFLHLADKAAVARGLFAIQRERGRQDLDRITMLDWLREKRQTPRAIERFWRQVLVSAVNEELDRMAASHGHQVMRVGFLGARHSYEMGVPNVPLGELYGGPAWGAMPGVELRFRTPVSRLVVRGGRVAGAEIEGGELTAGHYIAAVPFERFRAIAPEACGELGLRLDEFEHSPITGIHLWFGREVTTLPHATLLDRTVQWFFNKGGGRYLQLVVSASRTLAEMPRQGVIELALRELAEFLPEVKKAALLKAHVVKEMRATFSARPGLEALRPGARTSIENLSLAGDWTRSGWPSTMEGAVRSGYLAAEDAAARLGSAERFLLPGAV
jgi:zeta-carotene desaturase